MLISISLHGLFASAIIILLVIGLIYLYIKCKLLTIRYEAAKNDSMIDHLTGLYNTRYLHKRLPEEIKRSIRFNHRLYLLYIDLDNFKPVNDTFGHPEGDKVLVEATRIIRQAVRGYDVLVRNGGDEFVVLAAEISWEEAESTAERIRTALKNLSTKKCSGMITASIGLFDIADCDSADDALQEADTAMYVAKKLGKDRVFVSKNEKTVR